MILNYFNAKRVLVVNILYHHIAAFLCFTLPFRFWHTEMSQFLFINKKNKNKNICRSRKHAITNPNNIHIHPSVMQSERASLFLPVVSGWRINRNSPFPAAIFTFALFSNNEAWISFGLALLWHMNNPKTPIWNIFPIKSIKYTKYTTIQKNYIYFFIVRN